MAEQRKFVHEHVRDRIVSNIRNGPASVVNAVHRAIAQGSAEVMQALFTGNAYVPYGPTGEPIDKGVHGPDAPQPSVEERAKESVDLQEARQKEVVDRAVAKEIGQMPPEMQGMAAQFAQQPECTQPTPHWRDTMTPRSRGIER